MSFNQQHINITLANYEEAFLLYIDGELSEESMAAVEAFVLLHPDLQEEFDILLTTKLDSEVFVLDNKESLLAENMKRAITDEDLLLYLDNELTPEQKFNVENKLAADTEYKRQHQLLMSTKLLADEGVVYPNKSELYRHTEKRIQPKLWMRIAAAIVILLGIGILWTNIGGKQDDVPNPVQAHIKKIDQPTVNPEKQKAAEPALADIAVQKPEFANEEKNKASIKKELVISQSPQPAPERTEDAIALNKPAADDVALPKTDATEKVIVQQQTINTHTVITTAEPAYTTIDATITETGFSHAVAISNDDKKGSVRGFLRKASRFIERRTGINPVNEDDELVISVVALKLK